MEAISLPHDPCSIANQNQPEDFGLVQVQNKTTNSRAAISRAHSRGRNWPDVRCADDLLLPLFFLDL